MRRFSRSFPAKTEPNEVKSGSGAEKEADKEEIALIEPLIEAISDPAPEEHARYQVAKNRREGVAFIFHSHFELPESVEICLILITLYPRPV